MIQSAPTRTVGDQTRRIRLTPVAVPAILMLFLLGAAGCGETLIEQVRETRALAANPASAAVSGLSATLDGDRVTLAWSDPATSDVIGFQVTRNGFRMPSVKAPPSVTHDAMQRPWLTGVTSTAFWQDRLPGPGAYRYEVRSMLFDGGRGPGAVTTVVWDSSSPTPTTTTTPSTSPPGDPAPETSAPCLPPTFLLKSRADLICLDIAQRTTSDTGAPVSDRVLYAFPVSPAHPALASDAQFGGALLTVEFADAGSDGVWMTGDDTIQFLETRIDASTAEPWLSTLYAPGNDTCVTSDDIREYARHAAVVGNTWTIEYFRETGPDQIWQTADDPVHSWDRTVSATTYRRTWTNGLPGSDGIWQTSDDVTTSTIRRELDGGGRVTATSSYTHPGGDGIFGTPDDFKATLSVQQYDAQGRPTRSVRYEFDWPGATSRAVSAFEMSYAGLDAVPIEIRSILPGTDATLGTADDSITYGTPTSTLCSGWAP